MDPASQLYPCSALRFVTCCKKELRHFRWFVVGLSTGLSGLDLVEGQACALACPRAKLVHDCKDRVNAATSGTSVPDDYHTCMVNQRL